MKLIIYESGGCRYEHPKGWRQEGMVADRIVTTYEGEEARVKFWEYKFNLDLSEKERALILAIWPNLMDRLRMERIP
jgi:hypothetical protein